MKRREDQLEQQLSQWFAESKRQHPLPEAQKQLFSQTGPQLALGKGLAVLRWLSSLITFRRLQALTAVISLGVAWQLMVQQPLYYQISQSDELYPVQIHQLSSETDTVSTETTANGPQPASRSTVFAQRFAEYAKSRQQIQAMHQLVVTRLPAPGLNADGWQLVSCEQVRLKLTDDWLAEFKREQGGSEQQWQQLTASRWLTVSTGSDGQIITLRQSNQPPQCAP